MSDQGLFKKLASIFSGLARVEDVSLTQPRQLERSALRIPAEELPIELRIGAHGKALLVCPEIPVGGQGDNANPAFILIDPEVHFSQICGFLRLKQAGGKLILGSASEEQRSIFHYPDNMEMRTLTITQDEQGLTFMSLLSPYLEISLSQADKAILDRIDGQRRENLRRIREVYGGPIEQLSPGEALATLRHVNRIMEGEVHRPLDDRGRPGGLVRIPADITPIVIGDLHAQVDNLLTLLSQNQFLRMMQEGSAAIIFLGDAVHSEVNGELDQMASSMLMMDLIFKLKLRYPRQVFFLRGNHDSFAEDQFKFGVAQCLLWQTTLRAQRGVEYLEEMEKYYDWLPYVALSDDFVACHAAPIRTRFKEDMLINIYRNKGLIRELTRNRLRRRSFPAGYTRADVKHFRSTLGLSEGTPFYVSHSPLSRDDAHWPNAGGIQNHHIVYSANSPWIGVATRVGGDMINLRYKREALSGLV